MICINNMVVETVHHLHLLFHSTEPVKSFVCSIYMFCTCAVVQ